MKQATEPINTGVELFRKGNHISLQHTTLSPQITGTSPSYHIMVNHSHNLSDDESLWKAANPNIKALQDIISAHFRLPCCDCAPLGGGAYARVYLFTLEDGQ